MAEQRPDPEELRRAQRRAAVRTALILAVAAVAIYVWGIVSRL